MDIEAFDQSLLIAQLAGLLADASRATMVLALMDGRAYTANELARAANVSPQTASFHLAKLTHANLVQYTSQGRHRYFRLSGPEIAQTIETFLTVRSVRAPRGVPNSCPPHLQNARCCYDHLAGRLGVAIYRAMLDKGWVVPAGSHLVATAAAGPVLLELDIQETPLSLRAKPCLDWSEREFHLAGNLGQRLLRGMLDKRWLLRGKARIVSLTEDGRRRLQSLGLAAV